MALSMGITDVKLLLCHGIATDNNNKDINMTEYNDRKVFDYFNNISPDNCDTQDLNIPHMAFDYSPRPPKIPCNTFDMLPATISAASKNSLSTLTSPCDSPTLHLPSSGGPITYHNSMTNTKGWKTQQRGYCARRHGEIICNKNLGSFAQHVLFTGGFITVIDPTKIIQRCGLTFLNINILWLFLKPIDVFASLVSIPSTVELDFKLFLFLLSCAFPLALFWSVWLESLSLLSCSGLLDSNDDSPGLKLCCNYVTNAWIGFLKGMVGCLKKNDPLLALKLSRF